MLVSFNDTFHPNEDKKRERIEFVNNILRESLKNNGECCCNCKHMYSSHIGLGIMLPCCKKTKKFIKEDIKCKHYQFCGFIETP